MPNDPGRAVGQGVTMKSGGESHTPWGEEDSVSEHSAEMVAYVVAFTILVVAGMFLRTIILNFFVGPLIVVGSVALVTPLLSRRRSP